MEVQFHKRQSNEQLINRESHRKRLQRLVLKMTPKQCRWDFAKFYQITSGGVSSFVDRKFNMDSLDELLHRITNLNWNVLVERGRLRYGDVTPAH